MRRGLWDRETVAILLVAAYLPLALIWIWFEGGDAALSLLLILLILAIWQLVFLLLRAQAPSLSAVATALAIAMLAPRELGPLPLILGVSFGAVMGELVFGGWGRNVVNPSSVALAFLGFGFPGFDWPEILLPVAWAAIPAALIGITLGVMPGPVILGAALAGAGGLALGLDLGEVLPAASVVLVLLVGDPVTSAATALGRWLNGVVYALLVTLFATGWSGAAPVQIAVSAALLASLAAPLLDEAAIALWRAQRRRRHGRP
ncbi:RnfABCDGE type electron transport complex subunit D [Defluviimonas sp. WL0002]|uniref:RnfABCDGE type electron transport complex subunit D n=1 Tax=Albidovulum marisflavi TaxID=2984159 RepID=A0ABT2ZC02_9RHOB|nr:RnfABCDGE type electron transport complex subunit D [Defluviimonas sp. WL0002]MCV2868678.1 RnfABCDGE type electron transport complex subunit D [Defluviimonas sp. WL0002]